VYAKGYDMEIKRKATVARPKQKSLRAPKEKVDYETYETDFFRWTKNQSDLLKKKKFSKLDLDNLVEEIESLGRSDKRSLKSHFIILLQHLLKMQYQPAMRTPSWDNSIRNARLEIELILEDSPSLKKELSKMISSAYDYARKKALIETGLGESAFPEECPWKFSQIFPNL